MNKLRVQVTIDIEYETGDVEVEQKTIVDEIEANVRNSIHQIISTADMLDVSEWDMKTKIIDQSTKVLADSRRDNYLAFITAYFSADGPAFQVALKQELPTFDISSLLQDLNAALREAHHKYRVLSST